jgi:hypothetical protein
MVNAGVPEEEASFYAESIRRGGSVVTAKVDEGKVVQAQSILDSSRTVDVAARRRSYAEQGWSRFDEAADPYTPEQIAAERDRYRTDRI